MDHKSPDPPIQSTTLTTERRIRHPVGAFPVMTLLDIDGAADHLNVNPRFIRRLIAQRRINYLKIGKFVRFDQDDLDNWIQHQRVDARQSA